MSVLRNIADVQIRFLIKRSYSSESTAFIGRDLINPDHLSTNDVKSLLWTAKSMKTLRNPSDLLAGRHVTLLFRQPNLRFQIGFEQAAQRLGAKYTSCTVPQQTMDAGDCGRLVSSMTDVIVTNGMTQSEVEQLADGSKVPVINTSSDTYSQTKALTDLLTLLDVAGPLRRKSLAWVGPPTALCNAFIYLAPKLKLNLRLFCIGTGRMSAVKLDHGLSRCRGQSEIHQCASLDEAVYRADVIAVAAHDVPNHCLSAKVLEEAALDWYLLHELPRSGCEVASDVFRHKNNLTWMSATNTQFVAMAILLKVLRNFEPTCPMPDFDGPL